MAESNMPTFETSMGAETSTSVGVDADGKSSVTEQPNEGLSVEIGMTPGAKVPEKPVAATPAVKPPEKPETEAPKVPDEKSAEKPAALPDFKPDDAAVTEKYQGRYLTADGGLNKDALSAEFWSNGAEGKPGALNEGTYAFLQQKFGVSRDLINDFEAGLVAKQTVNTQGQAALVSKLAGSMDAYKESIKWAVDGGYTKDQQGRFNRLQAAGGPDFEDAVVALVTRYRAANPNAGTRPARASSPARSATDGRGTNAPAPTPTPAAAPFASNADYMAALKEAGKDPKKGAEVRARLAASNFHR